MSDGWVHEGACGCILHQNEDDDTILGSWDSDEGDFWVSRICGTAIDLVELNTPASAVRLIFHLDAIMKKRELISDGSHTW